MSERKREREDSPVREGPTIHTLIAHSPLDALTTHILRRLQPHLARQHLELELRLGTILDRNSGRRSMLNVETPAVVNVPHKMEASIKPADFEKLMTKLDKHEGLVARPEKHSLDRVMGDGVRCSFAIDVATGSSASTGTAGAHAQMPSAPSEADLVGKEPTCAVKKEKLVTIDITLPKMAYDLRLCLSTETPASSLSKDISCIRQKKRLTFAAAPEETPFIFEGTVVLQQQLLDNAKGPQQQVASAATTEQPPKIQGASAPQYEFEVEADMDKIGPQSERRAAAIQSMVADAISLIAGLR